LLLLHPIANQLLRRAEVEAAGGEDGAVIGGRLKADFLLLSIL
jgi:hypothetical protein